MMVYNLISADDTHKFPPAPIHPRALEPFGKYAFKKQQTSPRGVLKTASPLPEGQGWRGRLPPSMSGAGLGGDGVRVRGTQRKSQQEVSGHGGRGGDHLRATAAAEPSSSAG